MPIATIKEPNVDIEIKVELPTGSHRYQAKSVMIFVDSEDRITELRDMLFRAANTLDPQSTPAWVTDLLDVLDGVPR